MIYQLSKGGAVDTDRDLDFEERNFIQKMLIYQHLKIDLTEFRNKWRSDGNPIWKGPSTLDNPSPAVKILLDMEGKLERGFS